MYVTDKPRTKPPMSVGVTTVAPNFIGADYERDTGITNERTANKKDAL